MSGAYTPGHLNKLSDYILTEINGVKFYRDEDWSVFIFPEGNALRGYRKIENTIKRQRQIIDNSDWGAEDFLDKD